MKINADFAARAVMHFAEADWVASPMPGVERKMLDRIGGEVARATSIVRYAPGSAFSPHTHDGGEEYLVLDGTFEDESGAFPAGLYVRNPPGSRHRPAAPDGATILVKLHQFDPADRRTVHVDTRAQTGPVLALLDDPAEIVQVARWAPGQAVTVGHPGGTEVFVLDGGFAEAGESFEAWDWLRLPPGADATATAGPDGARVWIKQGHLLDVRAPA